MARLTHRTVNQALMSGMDMGALVLDRDLTIRDWNEWLQLQTRILSRNAVGQPLLDLFPCLSRRGIESMMRQVLDTGMATLLSPLFHRYFIPIQNDAPATDGRMIQQAKLLPLKQGELTVGVLVLLEDYSERMAFEQTLTCRNTELQDERQRLCRTLEELHAAHRKLQETQQRLVETERLKTLMETAGAAAHEINQPLQVIMTSLEILHLENSVDAQGQDILGSIREQVNRIVKVLRQMRKIQRYATTPYAAGSAIVDLGTASGSC